MRNLFPLRSVLWLLCAALAPSAVPQSRSTPDHGSELRLHLAWPHSEKHRAVPAVLWLQPSPSTAALPSVSGEHYTLLQKNRMFLPHLLVVPVGAHVEFPNKDPFFHNVFSLFDGKRFDLGLYEAGSTKSVNFSREGISYIFCNIHPEMSAVVIALSTPLYAVADPRNTFALSAIPPGDYHLHLWIEGVPLPALDSMTRPVHIPASSAAVIDLGNLPVPVSPTPDISHANKFGQPYDPAAKSPY